MCDVVPETAASAGGEWCIAGETVLPWPDFATAKVTPIRGGMAPVLPKRSKTGQAQGGKANSTTTARICPPFTVQLDHRLPL